MNILKKTGVAVATFSLASLTFAAEGGVDYSPLADTVNTALNGLLPSLMIIGGAIIGVGVATAGIKIVKNLAKSA